MSVLQAAWQAIYTGAGLLWTAAWALLLGYAFSAAIQVFVAPDEAADELGGSGPREVSLAMGVGFVSSSCSFAALAATRALWTKGASLPSALAFLYASTNLVIELGVLLWIFLGWQFVLALYVGQPRDGRQLGRWSQGQTGRSPRRPVALPRRSRMQTGGC